MDGVTIDNYNLCNGMIAQELINARVFAEHNLCLTDPSFFLTFQGMPLIKLTLRRWYSLCDGVYCFIYT